MPNQSESIAEAKEAKTAPVEPQQDGDKPKRKGPRPAAEIRAEVEAEKEAEIEALRAQLAAMQARADEAEMKTFALASDPNPTLDDIYPDSVKGAPTIKGAVYGDDEVEGRIVIHFVEDGLTLDGQVRYRGEEYVLNPDHKDYESIAGIITMDEYAQETKWGKRFFREGPWRGKKFAEISEADMVGLSDEAKADLIAAVQKARQQA